MTSTLNFVERRGWFLVLRIASYIMVIGVAVVSLRLPASLELPLISYSLLTLGYALGHAFDKRHSFRLVTSSLMALQFAAEIVVEAQLVYNSGGSDSSYSALFLLTIVSAALAYRLVGTLLVATGVSAAYTAMTWFSLLLHANPPVPRGFFQVVLDAPDHVFYSVFLHLLIFYLVAFTSGYLAEHLEQKDRRLHAASRALLQARLDTDDILRHLNSGLLTVDHHGHLLYFNRAAERILGFNELAISGLSCEEVFAERMPELAECLMDGVLEQVAHPRREMEIVSAEGRRVPLGVSTSILTDEHGELRGAIAIFSDLTEAKKLEEKVRVADRLAAVGELSASIAHEIRNPLAAMSGSVEVLNSELQLEGENARLMELIIKESSRLNRILGDFLNYARLDRTTFSKVELCHVVSDVLDLVRHDEAYDELVGFDFDTDESIVYVAGDEGLIKQVLLNLTLNAVEAFGGGVGTVTIRIAATNDPSYVNLEISDNGPGMSEEQLGRMYEPFFSTKKSGTGLGLSIVHRICTMLNLVITAESRVNEGTTFVITFPRVQPEGVAKPVPDAAVMSGGTA